jgi:2,4-dienoyl-CoA reductase-like NADH-dependent reductase (Old Yellow Enzyme family)
MNASLSTKLFDPIRIGSVEIPNRIVKSAMAEGCATEDGRPTPQLIRMYERWAKGGVGLAITGMAYIRRGYSYTGSELGLYDDALIAPMKALTDAVHANGGRVFAQICHAPPQLPRSKARILGAVAPSTGLSRTTLLINRALRDDELWRLVDEFADAARRARAAGFDGVQLHAAHGYLLSRTLSPRFNRRRDGWGGSFDRRLRFLGEVYRAMRCAVSPEFPIAIKMNAHDGVIGGLREKDSLRVADRLESWGFDAIEVSAGVGDIGLGCYPNKGEVPWETGSHWLGQEFPFLRTVLPYLRPVVGAVERSVRLEKEAYFLDSAKRFADRLSIPVITVGGVRSLGVARQIIDQTRVSMVSLARPLVRQPNLPEQWRTGRTVEAQCSSCNECFVRLGLGEPLRCWKNGRA